MDPNLEQQADTENDEAGQIAGEDEVGDVSALAPQEGQEQQQEGEGGEQQEQPQSSNTPPKWALNRINEETNRRKEEAAARARVEAENATLKEMLARMQKGEAPQTEQPQRQEQTRQPSGREPDFDRAVEAGINQRMMAAARNEVIQSGYTEFGKARFDELANVLAAMNCTGDEFVSDVLAVNRSGAHKLLAEIANDPENAGRLAEMDSRSRIAELTRMSMSAQTQEQPKPQATQTTQAAPKPVSTAPKPKPAMAPVASNTSDPNDLMDENISDDEFLRRWKKVNKVA